ncbi:hypothetical protein HBH92_127480 [Parastagonospora nodorum]|nr:hypothetical protein HBH92_127480 [Parastagonospora nodorum]KAH4426783.1 hypothetical protein HBH93_170700 [Parastagonospora nodorum]KAH4441330.1 hypothetical protein HBH91_169560 [Parastagonospora nodorum]KAH4489715.1 hypothetical protein HBH89_188310 [Parastagonospora nodorum]KAH4539470.1 hypothetical protein HBH85_134390 [Parastagonospora nodorum]
MASITRQPFGELGDSRLQMLQSARNKQNAISANFDSPMKPTPTASTGKRQRAPEIFEDVDSENIDPSVFASPTKKSKTSSSLDFGFIKPSKFNLVSSPQKSASLNATPSAMSTRKILTPSSTKSTPINKSRGSPKNNRISAITKRRASSSPFRRVDPPSFNQSSPSLPFSIDAALSGTISSYTPKASVAATPVTATPAPVVSSLEESMPKGWFFEIHEDTPEQEAANLMEHSASVLDISSDDDVATKQRNEEQERGKENIPPPDFLLSQPRVHSATESEVEVELKIEEPVKRPRLRKIVQDAMDEDRRPLGDLAPSEFYGEGCDASSYVTVDAGIEKPSSLSKEFDFSCLSPEKETVEVVEEVVADAVDENAAPVEQAVADVAA